MRVSEDWDWRTSEQADEWTGEQSCSFAHWFTRLLVYETIESIVLKIAQQRYGKRFNIQDFKLFFFGAIIFIQTPFRSVYLRDRLCSYSPFVRQQNVIVKVYRFNEK